MCMIMCVSMRGTLDCNAGFAEGIKSGMRVEFVAAWALLLLSREKCCFGHKHSKRKHEPLSVKCRLCV